MNIYNIILLTCKQHEEMGDEYTELKVYLRVHQEKNGAYPINFTKDICVSILNIYLCLSLLINKF